MVAAVVAADLDPQDSRTNRLHRLADSLDSSRSAEVAAVPGCRRKATMHCSLQVPSFVVPLLLY